MPYLPHGGTVRESNCELFWNPSGRAVAAERKAADETQEAALSTDTRIETLTREVFARILESDTRPTDLNLDLDMADEYGLTSLNKVLFLMTVCDDAMVSMSSFTEPDVAAMHTLRDVVTALAEHAGNGGQA